MVVPTDAAIVTVVGYTEVVMSDAAVHQTCSKRTATERVPGATWFGAMVALWSIFFTLLVVSPETLDGVYDWLIGLAIVWEILMWIVVLPWAAGYLVLESSWAEWLKVLVVVLVAGFHLSLSAPRVKR